MAQNLKPIIDELKSKLSNREQIRDTVLENLKQTRETVEKTLKQVAQQTKESRIVHDYVIPFVESDKADQAMKFISSKLGSSPIVGKLEQARKSLIDLKVSQATPVEPVATSEATTVEVNVTTEEAAPADTETVTKTKKKSAKSSETTEA